MSDRLRVIKQNQLLENSPDPSSLPPAPTQRKIMLAVARSSARKVSTTLRFHSTSPSTPTSTPNGNTNPTTSSSLLDNMFRFGLTSDQISSDEVRQALSLRNGSKKEIVQHQIQLAMKEFQRRPGSGTLFSTCRSRSRDFTGGAMPKDLH